MADGSDDPIDHRPLRHEGAVCVVARLECARGEDEALARELASFAEAVGSAEPGCTSYYVTRQIGSPSHFAAHARFADWAAFEAHAETPHMALALPRISAALAAPVALEIFLEV